MWVGKEGFRRDLFVSADMLHVYGYLFMFVHRDWFVNTQNDPACPTREMTFWTIQQGGSGVGENIAFTEVTITPRDGANIRHK